METKTRTYYVLRHGEYDRERGDRGFVFTPYDSMDALADAWREHGGNMLQVDDVPDETAASAVARYGWGWHDRRVGHLSIEGHWLPKPLALPGVLAFSDLFDRSEPWDFETMNHRSGKRPPEGKRVEREYRTRGDVGVFCSVNLGQIGGPKHGANLAVHVRPEILERIGMHAVDVNDRLGWSIIAHKRGRALVILSHSLIIGSRWVAYIDPMTIPVPWNV